jgi:hypothetical protein
LVTNGGKLHQRECSHNIIMVKLSDVQPYKRYFLFYYIYIYIYIFQKRLKNMEAAPIVYFDGLGASMSGTILNCGEKQIIENAV